jgi:uncharacterized membrane protein
MAFGPFCPDGESFARNMAAGGGRAKASPLPGRWTAHGLPIEREQLLRRILSWRFRPSRFSWRPHMSRKKSVSRGVPTRPAATDGVSATIAGDHPSARCAITGESLPKTERVPVATLRPALLRKIRADHPDLPDHAVLSRAIVDTYRSRLIEALLADEHGQVRALDRDVAESIARHETIAYDSDSRFDMHRSLGERMADVVAAFGGSWSFISLFGLVLIIWMALNVLLGDQKAFDPYPFILLNLMLSCVAAVQAPIIMMSQKRQEAKDRLRSQSDYRVNLKAELEIRHLHDKLDHLLTNQWDRLAEIQQLQIEMLQEIGRANSAVPSPAKRSRNPETHAKSD